MLRPRSILLLLAAALVAGAASCAHPTVGRMRFRNQPPVWQVDDRRDVPVQPGKRSVGIHLYSFDAFVTLRLRGARRVTPPARGINSLGEVPDSTWFTNRIGRTDLDPDQVARGPLASGDGPEQHLPWTILSTKPGGISVGFVVRDARGVKYLLKFDAPGAPEMETATAIIVNRLLWAAGYNVPEDSLAHLRPSDLILAPDAEVKDAFGVVAPLRPEEVQRKLAQVERGSEGTMRIFASRYLPGVVLGGFSSQGVRADDPNDLIPHQERRDLRGMQAIFAWLNNTDVKDSNTLDTWVEDPERPGTHYVVHNLIDFGKALGVTAILDGFHQNGFAHEHSVTTALYSFLSLGLWRRPWDGLTPLPLRGIGLIESERYDPAGWVSAQPYVPFEQMDRFDAFWGAKIVARFTRQQIASAIDAGQLSDPQSREYLMRTLFERQQKTARTWFAQVTPLDGFEVTPAAAGQGYTVCFDDLLIRHALDPGAQAASRYAARSLDASGVAIGWTSRAMAGSDGRVCLEGLRPSASPESYTMVEIETGRGEQALPPVMLHLAADPASGQLRVIGLERG